MKRIITLMSFCLFAGTVLNGQALKVDADGDVGINLANPLAPLHVNGNVMLTNPGSNKNILGGQDNSRRLAMTSSTSSSASSAFFTMWGDETHDGPGATPARAGELAIGCGYFQVSPAKPIGGFGALKFEVKSNGQTHAYGGLYTGGTLVTSDKRLKNNISEFNLGLSEIMRINPKNYYYNGKAGTSSKTLQTGVLAQEFQKIVPHAVSTFNYDDYDNNVHEEYLAVNTGVISYMLVNAVKEQQDIIEDQNSRIEKLEGLVESLLAINQNAAEITLSNALTGSLAQNSPNPFNGTTTIDYVIPQDAQSARINIYDMSGNLMKKETISHLGAGSLKVNADNIPSGTYTYNLVVDGKVVGINKMILQN